MLTDFRNIFTVKFRREWQKKLALILPHPLKSVVVQKISVRLLFYAEVNSNQSYVREGC